MKIEYHLFKGNLRAHSSSAPLLATQKNEHEDPDIFLIKIMCKHVGVLKKSSLCMVRFTSDPSTYLFLASK